MCLTPELGNGSLGPAACPEAADAAAPDSPLRRGDRFGQATASPVSGPLLLSSHLHLTDVLHESQSAGALFLVDFKEFVHHFSIIDYRLSIIDNQKIDYPDRAAVQMRAFPGREEMRQTRGGYLTRGAAVVWGKWCVSNFERKSVVGGLSLVSPGPEAPQHPEAEAAAAMEDGSTQAFLHFLRHKYGLTIKKANRRSITVSTRFSFFYLKKNKTTLADLATLFCGRFLISPPRWN